MEGKDNSKRAEQRVNLKPIEFNFSAEAYHRYAYQYYNCKRAFSLPTFSLLPYYLLCRAIELELKARHLKRMTRSEVKKKFGHYLLKAYNALEAPEQILSELELAVLTAIDEPYYKTELAYFDPEPAMNGYEAYPDLEALDAIARKLIASWSTT